jgi:hypothetical protein
VGHPPSYQSCHPDRSAAEWRACPELAERDLWFAPSAISCITQCVIYPTVGCNCDGCHPWLAGYPPVYFHPISPSRIRPATSSGLRSIPVIEAMAALS